MNNEETPNYQQIADILTDSCKQYKIPPIFKILEEHIVIETYKICKSDLYFCVELLNLIYQEQCMKDSFFTTEYKHLADEYQSLVLSKNRTPLEILQQDCNSHQEYTNYIIAKHKKILYLSSLSLDKQVVGKSLTYCERLKSWAISYEINLINILTNYKQFDNADFKDRQNALNEANKGRVLPMIY